MEQVYQSISTQLLTQVIVPMFGSFIVIFVAMLILLSPVRNRVVRQLGAYAAMFAWLGWMAHVYKVV